ncbi:hypothetical protein [Aeoliella mucimassa]|uniref:hypothetical protein n=1 Tax=Aeoliella mucimassa TaxID=2527972 RepID=UPI0018D2C837|nr:hypothetical protein [Aeoliella mucimassa]
MKSTPDPSPEEIAQLCEEIRATWSEAETYRRLVVKPTPWHVPTAGELEEAATA